MKRSFVLIALAVLAGFPMAAIADPVAVPLASPAPIASTQPQPAVPAAVAPATVPTTPSGTKTVDPAIQIAQYIEGLEQSAAQAKAFGPFYISVYGPICTKHGGFAPGKVDDVIKRLQPSAGAWPVSVACHDGSTIMSNGPLP